MFVMLLATSLAAASAEAPPAARPVAAERQARATVRILRAARIDFEAAEAVPDAALRLSSKLEKGADQPLRLIEFP